MPKVSKTPKAKPAKEETIQSIFDWAGVEDKTAKPAPKPEEVSVSALQEQIKALTNRLDEQTRVNTALMAQPPTVTPQPVAQPKEVEIDTKGLPDPITEPEKYSAEIARRTLAAWKTQQQVEQQAAAAARTRDNELDGRTAALWDDFQTQYPDISDDEDRVAFAAEKAAKRAKAKGLDLEKYMFGPGRDMYLKDVAAEYKTIWPEATENDSEDDGLDTIPARQQEPVSRTAGIFGGQDSGGKPVKTSEAPAGDMLKDMKDIQRQMGIF